MARKPSTKPAPKQTAKAAAGSTRRADARPARAPKAAPVSWTAPIRLSDVVGQARAAETLRAAIRAGRIHHAWIFHGPAGVGKFTAALAFAAIILDPTSRPDLSGVIGPDPASAAQKLLAAGTHPDLHIITKELAAVSSVQQVRDSKQRNIAKAVLEEFLLEPASRTQGSGELSLASKVFIVDEAELIDPVGQNALLKTLEEPAPGSVIILVTANEERLLPTIRSRAQRVGFAPLSAEDMQRWLESSGLDLSGLDAPSREWLISYAGGSPGVARLALTTGIVEWHRTLAPLLAEADRGKYTVDLGQTVAKLIDDWAVAWVEGPGGPNASKDAANKAAARQMFRLLSEHYRARLRLAAARGDHQETTPRVLAALDLIAQAERQAEASVQGIFVMDNLFTQITQGAGA